MKIKFLMAGILGLVSATAFAQKGELKTAGDEYTKYEGLRANKPMKVMATKSLATARESIDKAAVNEKTANLPLTFALKGAIYSALAVEDTVPATSAPLFTTADAALKKAKELDTKGENKAMINNAYTNLAQYQFDKGRAEFQDKKYDLAYHSFDYYRQVMPDDTNAIYATALAAANAQNYNAAIANYNKLATTKYSKGAVVYSDLATIYLANKDTTGALKAISEGIAKYPSNADLRKKEIEIALQSNKFNGVIEKLQTAIANDPKNKLLYYYAGLTYSQLADASIKDIAKTKDVAAKTALQQKKNDNYAKAADMFKKAIEIDPNYFDAYVSLGYVMVNPAIDVYNAANQLPTNKQKEYDAAIAKANALFDQAKPYLLKAVELNPKSIDALTNLKAYYLGKKDMVNANKTKKQIEDLEGGK